MNIGRILQGIYSYMFSISGSSTQKHSYYRPDVDGLRALAIVPVLLFHIGYSGFGGGYIGVDVFFVISGYLISSILLRDLRSNNFSFVKFYERRARRILPALFVVLSVSWALAYNLFLPDDFSAFSHGLIAAVFSVSNIFFWNKSGNYFDDSTDTNAVVHTWSLSVEEQFYIFFPLFLFFVFRFFRSSLNLFLWVIFVFSLLLSVYAVEHHPKAAFYLLPTRTWELALGAMAAAACISLPNSALVRNIAAIIGLAGITFPVFLFNNTTPFPGYNALYPCVGAVLIILAGQGGHRTLVASLLASRPLVFIGLISYSLYLWHWPLIVFGKYYNVHLLTSLQKLIIVALSIGLATFSWKFVEQPFRQSRSSLTRYKVFALSAAGIGIFTLVSVVVVVKDGLRYRFAPPVLEMVDYADSTNLKSKRCSLRPSMTKLPSGEPCVYGADVDPKYAIWGDSHGDSLIAMLGELGEKHGSSTVSYIYHDCAVWLRGYVEDNDAADHCAKFRLNTLASLKQSESVETIFIVSRWVVGLLGSPSGFGPAENEAPSLLMRDRDGGLVGLQERKAHLRRSMLTIVAELTAAGKQIVFVHPIPETGYNVPRDLALLSLRGGDPAQVMNRPYSFYLQRQVDIIEVLESLPNKNVFHIRPAERLCDDTHCKTFAAGAPLYHDDDHLSLEGARYLAPLFERYM